MKAKAILFTVALLLSSCIKEKKSIEAGLKMQEFVIGISNYARNQNNDFIVIPQNGEELAFKNLDPTEGVYNPYLAAIDGFGIEELFYNGTLLTNNERLPNLQTLALSKKIMVADYLNDDSYISTAIQKNMDEGFITFPRTKNNYDYIEIPTTIANENSNNILNLQAAQNYLYLISTTNFSSKQQMITAIANTNFDVVLIDLFFDETEFTASEIAQLKTKANGAQRIVIAYMNIGAAESYRYYWKSNWKLHKPKWLKKPYDGYEDEIWVEFWNPEWQNIIYGNENSYTQKIINAGFDGIYLDNVENYYFLYFE